MQGGLNLRLDLTTLRKMVGKGVSAVELLMLVEAMYEGRDTGPLQAEMERRQLRWALECQAASSFVGDKK
jgi:hypothetical protein